MSSLIPRFRTRGEWPVSGLRKQHLDWSVNGRNGPELDAPQRAQLVRDGAVTPVWITALTSTDLRLRGVELPAGRVVGLRIQDVGELEAVSVGPARDGTRLQLLTTPEQADALDLKLYAEDNVPGIPGARTALLLRDLARRLAFTR